MKKLTLIFTLLFSTVMFLSPSFAKWTRLGESVVGDEFYVDFDRIRKHGEFIYYWRMTDYLKVSKYGDLSYKSYKESDCKLFRFKVLSGISYKEPMGRGAGESYSPKNPEWQYPAPNSVAEKELKIVCSRVGLY